MAFWNKRASDGYTSGNPGNSGVVVTVVGVIVVGMLLFGVFSGARWVFGKIADNSDPKPRPVATTSVDSPAVSTPTTTTDTAPAPTTTPETPSVTVTSSTATTTPNVASALPHTGPGSTVMFFLATFILTYLVSRRLVKHS